MNWTFYYGLVVFVGTYILIASEKVHKTAASLLGAALMLLVILPGPAHNAPAAGCDALSRAIEVLRGAGGSSILDSAHAYSRLDVFSRFSDFDVIFTLAGMMLLVNLLSTTGLFQFVAVKCAKLAKGLPIRTMILLVIATAFLSAFLDNVTTILLVAPVTLLVAQELDVPPVPFLMAETMASNIGGTATLIGDPPNLIIGSAANLDFMAFLINLTPFIIVLMALYCIGLWIHYGKSMKVTVEKRAIVMEMDENAAITDRSNLRRGGIVMILTILGFLLHGALGLQPCVVAMSGAALALCICRIDVDHALEKIEWGTLFFFMGLFVVVSGAQYCGVMTKIGEGLSLFSSLPVPVVLMSVLWISGIAAAIMNNVSFTAAMVAVIAGFITSTPSFSSSPAVGKLLWWSLALGVCLGGNGSLIGAAANLVTVNIAGKNGYKVTFGQFLSYGIPVTLFSMFLASAYILFRYFVLHG